jgi:hypothetical protein
MLKLLSWLNFDNLNKAVLVVEFCSMHVILLCFVILTFFSREFQNPFKDTARGVIQTTRMLERALKKEREREESGSACERERLKLRKKARWPLVGERERESERDEKK